MPSGCGSHRGGTPWLCRASPIDERQLRVLGGLQGVAASMRYCPAAWLPIPTRGYCKKSHAPIDQVFTMRNLAIFCCLALVLCAAATPSGTNDLDVSSGSCTSTLSGGDGFIQIGNWRFGSVDDNHFSFSSNNGRTAVILRSDGTVHGGNGQRSDYGLSHKPITWTYSASKPFALEKLPNIQFGSSWVQFGPNCRLGTPDNGHLSVSFKVPCCGASGIHTAGIDCFVLDFVL